MPHSVYGLTLPVRGMKKEEAMKILNAFSVNMLATFPADVVIEELSLGQARGLAIGGESCVGHADTAAVFSAVLGCPVAFNRATVTLEGDALLGQYSGPRLPEGATALPAGATIRWFRVGLRPLTAVCPDCQREIPLV